MKIAREEIFGPVMSMMPFKIWTKSSRAQTAPTMVWPPESGPATSRRRTRSPMAFRAGTVWVNCYHVLDTRAPFGGFKQSGIGRELGEYGLQEYTEVKTVTVKL